MALESSPMVLLLKVTFHKGNKENLKPVLKRLDIVNPFFFESLFLLLIVILYDKARVTGLQVSFCQIVSLPCTAFTGICNLSLMDSSCSKHPKVKGLCAFSTSKLNNPNFVCEVLKT